MEKRFVEFRKYADRTAFAAPMAKPIAEFQWRNQGTSMIAVRDALKARAPALLAEMTVLD
jgi:hypothetical protein